jgi:hypothetical protein
MADPPQPHGPYYQWTRKVASKTVGRWLSPEQAADYQIFIDNHRRLRCAFDAQATSSRRNQRRCGLQVVD